MQITEMKAIRKKQQKIRKIRKIQTQKLPNKKLKSLIIVNQRSKKIRKPKKALSI